jgi:5-methylcytosine-specific restriction enzyme subunit McrC
MFRLEPDLLIEHEGESWVLDTKWKRLDAFDKANKYGLSQTDFYQLFAYGMKYLSQTGGQLALVFPKSHRFLKSLPMFDLGHGLSLRVLPFDLENEVLIDSDQIALPVVRAAIGSKEIEACLAAE